MNLQNLTCFRPDTEPEHNSTELSAVRYRSGAFSMQLSRAEAVRVYRGQKSVVSKTAQVRSNPREVVQ